MNQLLRFREESLQFIIHPILLSPSYRFAILITCRPVVTQLPVRLCDEEPVVGSSVSNINGMKTITVKEAGKTTTIQDQPSGAIGVRITSNGEPKQFAVTNLQELKKKDPAAFELYQQYGGNAGGQNIANVGFGGFGLPGGFGNNMNIIANGAHPNDPVEINNAGAVTAKRMMIQHLNELKKRMAGNPTMQQILDQQINDLQQ